MNPTELLGNIKDILNNSDKLGELKVTTVESKKGKYLQILDSNNNSVGIYISMINPDN
jgi:hypothetical protein